MISGIPYNIVLWDVSPIKHAVRPSNSNIVSMGRRVQGYSFKLRKWAHKQILGINNKFSPIEKEYRTLIINTPIRIAVYNSMFSKEIKFEIHL